MIIQYIRNHQNEPVGVMVADCIQNSKEIQIGVSILHPNDVAAIAKHNKSVRITNAAIHKAINQGSTVKLLSYLPTFDKKKAIEIAVSKMANTINIASVPYLRDGIPFQHELLQFVERVTRYFQGSSISLAVIKK